MQVTAKVLVKGVSQRDGVTKAGVAMTFHNVELYGLEGRPADIRAGVDVRNGGAPLWEKAKRAVLQPVLATLDVSSFNGIHHFSLLDIQTLQQK